MIDFRAAAAALFKTISGQSRLYHRIFLSEKFGSFEITNAHLLLFFSFSFSFCRCFNPHIIYFEMEIKRPIHFYSHSIIDIFALETRLNTNFGRFIDVPSRFSSKIIKKKLEFTMSTI